MSKELVCVKFVRKNAPYNSGEIAGFAPSIAANLVKAKRAVYYTPEAEEEKPKDPEPSGGDAIVPEHLGGSWYMVGDEKVQGKAKALEYAAELNAGADAPPAD